MISGKEAKKFRGWAVSRLVTEYIETGLYGVFAVLLLTGALDDVPPKALGVGCAVGAVSSLVMARVWAKRLDDLDAHVEDGQTQEPKGKVSNDHDVQ